MARKPKATGDPKPPKRKMTQAEQSALFIETARKLGSGETEEDFERAFTMVARPRKPSASSSSDLPSAKADPSKG
jgi:hypothetical protein